MHFDKIIMNPPYDRSLHLKILRQVMNKADEVVNLSPIRWLSDELAEYKKTSEYNKFADIRNRISNLEVIKSVDAENAFGIALPFDLGIYYITPTITNYSFSKNRIVNTFSLLVHIKMCYNQKGKKQERRTILWK